MSPEAMRTSGRVLVVPVDGGKVKLIHEEHLAAKAYELGRADQLADDRAALIEAGLASVLGEDGRTEENR